MTLSLSLNLISTARLCNSPSQSNSSCLHVFFICSFLIIPQTLLSAKCLHVHILYTCTKMLKYQRRLVSVNEDDPMQTYLNKVHEMMPNLPAKRVMCVQYN